MSGLRDIAMAGGFVVKPSNGWYSKAGEEKKYREKELNEEFWQSILADPKFQTYVQEAYSIGTSLADELDFEVEGES